jgi:hypothetical protein
MRQGGLGTARGLPSRTSGMMEFERLLVPGSTELPACRCGEEMRITRTDRLESDAEAHIRVYNCPVCHHEMRLTVWATEQSLPTRLEPR